MICNRPSILAATLITIGSLAGEVRSAIVVTEINAISTTIDTDRFAIVAGVVGGLFFGNMTPTANQNTADRIPILYVGQYFQPDTNPLSFAAPQGSTIAYAGSGLVFSGAASGINFSTYDLDQDGIADALFMLDFGPNIFDISDDLIVALARETTTSPIDLEQARVALLNSIPEPSSALLLGMGAFGLVASRRRAQRANRMPRC